MNLCLSSLRESGIKTGIDFDLFILFMIFMIQYKLNCTIVSEASFGKGSPPFALIDSSKTIIAFLPLSLSGPPFHAPFPKASAYPFYYYCYGLQQHNIVS